MAAEVTYRHGDDATTHIDYTPAAGDIAAGTVVLLGNTAGLCCGIADKDLTNNVKGQLAVGGYWRGLNLNNAANYAKVYWDDSVNKFTTVSTNNALFGFVAEDGGGGANSNCVVEHVPYV
jgi:hypothetical protein